MLNKYPFQKKYLIFVLLSLFILSLVTGCSDANANIENPIEKSKQHQEVDKSNEEQSQKENTPEETTEKTSQEGKPIEKANALKSEQVLNGDLEVHYIDVGQADSIFIKLPNEQTILIDAGNNDDGDLVVNYLTNQGVKKLHHVIGTHPHEDHIGGLDIAISSFDVGKVYLPKVTHTTKTYEDLLNTIKNKGLKVTEAKGGVKLDTGEGIAAIFLAPNGTNYESLNDYSAVLKLIYGKTGFLFTGDAEKFSEDEMLRIYKDQLPSDVLKVGHHGSTTSSSPAFIKAVGPKYSIISVGKDNSYGHPDNIILSRLKNYGDVYRTDQDGTVIATSNGQEITFNKAPTPIKPKAPAKTTDKATAPTPKEEVKPVTVPQTDNIQEVYITKTGSKYHIGTCSSLRSSKIPISLEKAKADGYEPCGRCNPPK